MAADEKKAGEGFTVNDRRRVRSEAPEAAPAHAEAPKESEANPAEEHRPRKGEGELPPVDFSTFVLSLASSALVHLGEVVHPETGEPARNLPLARQTIDMLAMLQEKTRGNLSKDEATYLESILYDLRLRCVAACQSK
ncbi:MAG: DUF1844 domain-containing protein [Deltaproteobacteria bacterium]|nr:DUF1844 domain-containing protein [Deltaproteobacteria bacterium]